MKRFYSNGKLMLTGEYVALDGAKVLALPTKYGQDLTIREGDEKKIRWTSYEMDGNVWYEDVLGFDEITAPTPTEPSVRNTLLGILHAAAKMNPSFLSSDGYQIETRLTFPRLWGLGTSSTLLNNIADWLQIDPYVLLQDSFGGSGYDIACARNDKPILFQRQAGQPVVQPAGFEPVFKDNLFFVYLNRKQSSKAAIASYYANRNEGVEKKIAILDDITEKLCIAENAGTFARGLQHHEAIISDIVEMQTVKEYLFPDFEGTLKSLGGWGGDFVMAVSKTDPAAYFQSRGFDTVIPYGDMVL